MREVQISIIIPCYNHGNFLGETLDSVLSQSFQSWECIIVDNGSTDNTKSVAEKYVQRDNRFSYHFTANKGVSAARNHGIKHSSGKYLLPLDADDKIGNTYLQKGVSHLDNNPHIMVVYCDVELFGEINRKWELPEHTSKNMLLENTIFCSGIYRKTDYLDTSGYDETMLEGLEDWEFWITLLKNGGEVYKIPEILFYYRIRKTSRNNSLDKIRIKEIRKYIYEKHKMLYDSIFSISDLLFELSESSRTLDALKGSREYKTGSFLLRPFRALQLLMKPSK